MTGKDRKARSRRRENQESISRLADIVNEMLDDGADPAVVREALTVVRRNLSLPVPRIQRLTVALVSASLLSPKELRGLRKLLLDRITEDEEDAAEIPARPRAL
jgi:hypothetical protein